jgi:hypothetical protein
MNAKEYYAKETNRQVDELDEYDLHICNVAEEYHQAKLKDELPTEGEIKKEFVNEFGDAPTKWNKFRLQGAKWAINLLKEKK